MNYLDTEFIDPYSKLDITIKKKSEFVLPSEYFTNSEHAVACLLYMMRALKLDYVIYCSGSIIENTKSCSLLVSYWDDATDINYQELATLIYEELLTKFLGGL